MSDRASHWRNETISEKSIAIAPLSSSLRSSKWIFYMEAYSLFTFHSFDEYALMVDAVYILSRPQEQIWLGCGQDL